MMKNPLMTALVFSALLLQVTCDVQHESEQQSISKKLSEAPWTPAEVKRDGIDITVEYAPMRLTFDTNTYSATHGSPAWPSTGTWTFPEGSTSTLLRDNTVLINITLGTDAKTLNMDFIITERKYTPGRATALEGEYHFRLIRQ